jgi:hypothetical protein
MEKSAGFGDSAADHETKQGHYWNDDTDILDVDPFGGRKPKQKGEYDRKYK